MNINTPNVNEFNSTLRSGNYALLVKLVNEEGLNPLHYEQLQPSPPHAALESERRKAKIVQMYLNYKSCGVNLSDIPQPKPCVIELEPDCEGVAENWSDGPPTAPTGPACGDLEGEYPCPTLKRDQRMRWVGEYSISNTPYEQGDVALQNGWLGIANKDTSETLKPEVDGPEFWIYSSDQTPTSQVTSKSIITGTRYAVENSIVINGYRIHVIGGNSYEVSTIKNPLSSNPIINQIASLDPSTTGWLELAINPVLAKVGDHFDLIVTSRQPDPSPVIYEAVWNYTLPNNASEPISGQATHSSKELTSLRFNKIDQGGADQSAALEALTIGDIIATENIEWSIQAIIDNGSWIEFSIAPAQQDLANPTMNFQLRTVEASPITYMFQEDWWTANASNVQGLVSLDGDYSKIQVSGDAYGADILVQNFTSSEDWDFLAQSDLISDGGISINHL